MKNTLLILVFGWMSFQGFAQTGTLDSLLSRVESLQRLRLEHYSTDRREEVFLAFDSAVVALFRHPGFCEMDPETSRYFYRSNQSPDENDQVLHPYTFMNDMVMCTSPDKRLRVFSWDDLGGGSFHSFTNYLLFEHADGHCRLSPFDTAESCVEVGYYEIVQFREQGRDFYLLTGYGTYGGGQHHVAVRTLEVSQDEWIECFECYPNQREWVIYSNRSQDPDLGFDPNTLELSFREYEYDNETGFYQDKYQQRKLKFENGKWTQE
jgi:hypothetical protein